MKPASSIVVIGSGGVGQAVIQDARIAGAARIIAVDPLENKQSAALGSGATDAIDPTSADLVDEVRRLTGGRGAHHTFEVVGNPTTKPQAWGAPRPGGAGGRRACGGGGARPLSPPPRPAAPASTSRATVRSAG
ncbi:zinc-binding dehydrogenase, partial [Streptomyces sp. NPDC127079]|uniref:zinc-binding dehydrogenase n=1 Tax=Streptomyces sp. NPDC127079 TaxID=3347132 RepID=UPI00365D0FCF